jgi:hypothetical protein
MARKQQAEQLAENRRQREEEERQSSSPSSTPETPKRRCIALADEILKYRRAVGLLAKAIGWADAGAPFALIAPGPHWRPRRTAEMPDVAPPAA